MTTCVLLCALIVRDRSPSSRLSDGIGGSAPNRRIFPTTRPAAAISGMSSLRGP